MKPTLERVMKDLDGFGYDLIMFVNVQTASSQAITAITRDEAEILGRLPV